MTSVVIPVFNGAVIALNTISTVLRLHDVDEWIWVDDGSTDDTAKVLASATEREDRARVICLPRNQGRSAARNGGVEASRGDVVIFLDIDVEPRLDTARALTEAVNVEGAVASVGRITPVLDDPSDPYQDYLAHFARGPSTDAQPNDELDWRFFLSGVCAIRRDTLRAAGGFRTNVQYGEDIDLACRLAESAPDGLRLAETTVRLHDVGSLEQAIGRADAFGKSLKAFDSDCRRRAVGRLPEVPGARLAASVAAPVLLQLAQRLSAGAARRQAVRYLLATRILSATRRA